MDLAKEGGFVSFGDAGYDVGYGEPKLFHFLVVAPALAGIAGDDHIGHHFVDAGILLSFWVLEQFLKEAEEDGVFKSFFFVPVSVSFVLIEFPEGGLNNCKRKFLFDFVLSKDLLL